MVPKAVGRERRWQSPKVLPGQEFQKSLRSVFALRISGACTRQMATVRHETKPRGQRHVRRGRDKMVKWMTGAIVAASIAVGVAAVLVSVTVLQLSRIAADMQNHEYRTNASNSGVIVELQRLVDGMRDDYRERMHGVEEVLRELRAVRQRLNDGDEPNASRTRDLEQALSNVEHALTVLMLYRPVRTSDVTQRLKEIRDELRAIKACLEGTEESEDAGGEGSANDDNH